MVFSNPTYLWALLGLLVPLAIHLWSKKEAKTIKIGSVQLLEESNSRQSSSIQLNEWLLLLLRMLIVGLVVLLMSGPQWSSRPNKDQVTYLVEPSLANHYTLETILDSLSDDSPVLLLKKGFPEWDPEMEGETEADIPSYWQMVQKMDSLPSDSLVVFTNAYLQGIKSSRPTTQKKIHWVIMESEELEDRPLLGLKNNSEVELISIGGSGQETTFKKEKLTAEYTISTSGDSLRLGSLAVPLKVKDSIKVNLCVDEPFSSDQKYVSAVLKAISKFLGRDIHINEMSTDDQSNDEVNLHIWLSDNPWRPSNGKWLVFQENPMASELVIPSMSNNQFWLTSHLNSENITEQHFAEQLLKILNLNQGFSALAVSQDFRQMDEGQLKPNLVDRPTEKERASMNDVSLYVFLVLTVLMILERVISYFKRQ